MPLKFDLIKQDYSTAARLGKIVTSHGTVHTPAFMPVGTQGAVKSMLPEEIKNCGAEIILSNTYHLYLRPGYEIIKKIGGSSPVYELVRPDSNR